MIPTVGIRTVRESAINLYAYMLCIQILVEQITRQTVALGIYRCSEIRNDGIA